MIYSQDCHTPPIVTRSDLYPKNLLKTAAGGEIALAMRGRPALQLERSLGGRRSRHGKLGGGGHFGCAGRLFYFTPAGCPA
jgi:hypothetical protein